MCSCNSYTLTASTHPPLHPSPLHPSPSAPISLSTHPNSLSLRVLQSLQEESHKAQVQKSEALSRLQTVDSSKQGLEEKVTELQRTNTQLQVCLLSQEYVSIFHTK